ncbi:type III-A CRISPR-associated RAMP protein Csm4 [Streptococcus cristatus]|uniref:CRISPR system Cms protein Csm4 n=1 Tax=Streptococcus cristatus TaxID=45634 RepID=A0A139MZE9_STRCR|nr:type III-A CRISPR-associated RAMP protein Csm4 [Streptococcus cristatus]KXT69129.1 CRISPR-associated RAMP protein, Csm4 family [Streptococcus cristatus]
MAYQLYKLDFSSAHFGEGNLDDSVITFTAARLYSALVLEAIKMGVLDEFERLSQKEDFVLTDAFPYMSAPYLPKPIGYPLLDKIKQNEDIIKQREEAKKAKKLAFIKLEDFDYFLAGKSIAGESLVTKSVNTKNQPLQDGNLYQVASVHFDKSSLYFIANQSELLEKLLESLQYTGLGGKRSSGYGGFTLDKTINQPLDFLKKLTVSHSGKVMALTTSLPVDDDLADAMDGGRYLLKKASGFAFSEVTVSNYRKQDLYTFKAGSTFSKTYKGQIRDVRPSADFPHPVWHYAKPLFYILEESK